MDVFIGTILAWPMNFEPIGWAFCDGRSLQVAQYQALYSLIGTTYGGNGNCFNLPDLRGRFPIGQGTNQNNQTTYTIGQTSDNNKVTLTPNNVPVPQHTHQITNSVTVSGEGGNVPASLDISIPVNTDAYNTSTSINSPTNNNCTLGTAKTSGGQAANTYTTSAPTPGASLKTFSVQTNINVPQPTVTVNSTCNNNDVTTAAPFDVMSPYLSINYIIALEGYYPSRS